MVRRLRAFGAFWYDFVVGDDWRVAVGVAVALGATAGLVHGAGLNAWWLPPVAVAVLLGLSLRRAVAAARR
ncbi:MAG: hypothetical protein HOY69_12395 [Streptomyces sp.]|nr:hypothetical protein [Streptomyces sp.]